MKKDSEDIVKQRSRRVAFWGRVALIGGLGVYVAASGMTGTCRTCSAITSAVGLPSLTSSAIAAVSDKEAPIRVTLDTPARANGRFASSKAPAWSLKGLDGEVVKSSDFAGKVVILDFWATWCPPCRAEIPGFIELQKKYGEKGLVVVGISLDDGPEGVRRFASQLEVKYPLVMGDEKVTKDYGGVSVIPTTFVIDRQGRIASRHVGFAEASVFEAEIKPLL